MFIGSLMNDWFPLCYGVQYVPTKIGHLE